MEIRPYERTTHHAFSREGKRSWNTFAVSETAEGDSLGGVVIRRGWLVKNPLLRQEQQGDLSPVKVANTPRLR